MYEPRITKKNKAKISPNFAAIYPWFFCPFFYFLLQCGPDVCFPDSYGFYYHNYWLESLFRCHKKHKREWKKLLVIKTRRKTNRGCTRVSHKKVSKTKNWLLIKISQFLSNHCHSLFVLILFKKSYFSHNILQFSSFFNMIVLTQFWKIHAHYCSGYEHSSGLVHFREPSILFDPSNSSR